jgi:hypothetical protein
MPELLFFTPFQGSLMARKPTNPRIPAGLGPAGRKLWTTMTAELEFEPREVTILQAACRQADDIARLEAVVKSEGSSIKGSKNQSRLHPALPELRQGRLALGRLLAALDIPVSMAAPQPVRTPRRTSPAAASRRAQHAANARWNRADRTGSGG